MELIRTIRLKLLVSPEQASELNATLKANRDALNFASQVAFNNGGISAFKRLQQLTYHRLREQFGLKSQMACNVCSTVAGTYASAKSNGRLLLANFTHSKLVYSYNRNYTIQPESQTLSLGTLSKRIKVPYLVGECYHSYLHHEMWTFGSAELVPIRKGFSLHVTVKCEIAEPLSSECDAMIGVDRGMNFLAVATNQIDEVMFFKGRSIKDKKAKFVRQRKELQHKGTRSAKRKLKQVAGRENRFMTDVNHQVANEIITFAKCSGSHPCIMLSSAMGDIPYPATAIVEQDAEALMIPNELYKQWLQQYPSIQAFTYQNLARRLSSVMTLIEEIAFKRIDIRLIRFLLEQTSEKQPRLYLTHEEIATELGTAREVISRVLKNLEGDHVVTLSRGKIEVTHRQTLENLLLEM